MNARRKKKKVRVKYQFMFEYYGRAQISQRAWITPGSHPRRVNIKFNQKCVVQPT